MSPAYSADDVRALSSKLDLLRLLADHVASIRMKVMRGARMGSAGVLTVVATLALCIAKWTTRREKAVLRLMSYVSSATAWTWNGDVGDPVEKLP